MSGGSSVTFASVISEAEDNIALRISSSGTGSVFFEEANTFTGGVVFNSNFEDSGTLRIASGATFGTGDVVAERWGNFLVEDVTLDNDVVLNGGLNVLSANQRMTINGDVLIGEEETPGGRGLSNPTFRGTARFAAGFTVHGEISNAATLR